MTIRVGNRNVGLDLAGAARAGAGVAMVAAFAFAFFAWMGQIANLLY